MTIFDASTFIGRIPGENLAFDNVEGLLSSMQRLGIQRAMVTHTVAWQHSPTVGNQLLMEALAPYPELEPCWVVTPGPATDEMGGADALCDQMSSSGVRAVRFYPRDHVFVFNDWFAGDLLAALNRRRFVCFIDLDQLFTQSGLYDYDARGLDTLATLSRHYPDLSIVISRVGYRAFQLLVPLLRACPNIYLDLSYLATHQGLEYLTRIVGAHRLMFGTSQPLVDAGGSLLRLISADLPDEARDMIASGTLTRLLERVHSTQPSSGKAEAAQATASNPLTRLRNNGIEITDAHVHLGPYYKFFIPDNDATGMLRVMDHVGIAHSCLSSHLAISGDWYLGNRETARAVANHPDRFSGYVVINPNEPALVEGELKRAFEEWGFRGIKLVPDTHRHPIGGEGYRSVFEFAAHRGCLVLVHTYHGSPFDDPQLFGPLADRYPEVPILLVHSGALPTAFDGAISLARKYPNLYLDISGSFITGEWIGRMVTQLGANRVLFSTDQPFIDPRYSLGRLLYAGLSKDALACVIGGNIRRLLGLQPSTR